MTATRVAQVESLEPQESGAENPALYCELDALWRLLDNTAHTFINLPHLLEFLFDGHQAQISVPLHRGGMVIRFDITMGPDTDD